MVSTSLSAMTPITRMRRPVVPDLLQVLGQGQGGRGVVGPVQQDPGVLGDLLQAARPAGCRQALPDGRFGHGKPGLAEQFHHRQGHRGIAILVPALQVEGQPGDLLLQAEIIESPPGFAPGLEVQAALVEGGVHFPAAAAEQLEHLFLPGIGDQRRPGLDDPRLLPGNGQKPLAQVFLVVPGDVGDHRNQRLNDVGGVQAAPHAGLQDDGGGPCLQEVEKGHGRGKLEEGGRFGVVHCGPDLVDQGQQSVRRHLLLPQAEALPKTHQVRRGEQAHGIAGPAQDGAEHGRHRPFAVGAGNMDVAALLEVQTQTVQQAEGGGQAKLDPELLQIKDPGRSLGQIGKRRHAGSPQNSWYSWLITVCCRV